MSRKSVNERDRWGATRRRSGAAAAAAADDGSRDDWNESIAAERRRGCRDDNRRTDKLLLQATLVSLEGTLESLLLSWLVLLLSP